MFVRILRKMSHCFESDQVGFDPKCGDSNGTSKTKSKGDSAFFVGLGCVLHASQKPSWSDSAGVCLHNKLYYRRVLEDYEPKNDTIVLGESSPSADLRTV